MWFWKAINAGDRVESALKDMAVVMKQLNRPQEAIEAIKSFRSFCPRNSQESLDNILIDLYKVYIYILRDRLIRSDDCKTDELSTLANDPLTYSTTTMFFYAYNDVWI